MFSQNFREILLRFRFINFRKKVYERRAKIFSIFREMFRSLETIGYISAHR